MKKVVVNKKAANSLKEFFPWVYKNDILNIEDFKVVELIQIVDQDDRFLGVGYINPNSIISIRVLCFENRKIDKDFFINRIKNALIKRVDIDSDTFRLIHSEADMIPGLIVDKYKEYLSIQINTAGILKLKDILLEVLIEELNPKGLIIDADRYNLKKEGIDQFERKIVGEVPREIIFEENSVKFYAPLIGGQKTGFYLDQRRNREIVASFIKQKSKVLDLFCNIGGFGLYAALKKDAQVELVDISEEAIKLAKRNFELNGVDGKFVCDNVFDYLRALRKEKRKYDLIIIDPPSFAKSKGQKNSALRGFKDLIVNSMKLVEDDGYIAIFSCSYYIGFDELKKVALKASKDNRKRLEIVGYLTQDIDHPSILNMPYSEYLKGLLLKIHP